jgi:hypothetical protein
VAFIAVEDELSNVRSALVDAGFQVVGMTPAELRKAEAVVVSGMDINLMQQQDICTEVPVINAVGRSAAEIVTDLKQRLG